MIVRSVTQVARLSALTLLAAAALMGASATAAHADRCEPEEIVLGPDSSPIHEDDNPACTVLFFYVYPFVCSESGAAPPPGLLSCPSNIFLNPNYQPPLIPPYNPDTGRLVCNLILFALPTATCTFTGDPASGTTSVESSLGSLEIPGVPS